MWFGRIVACLLVMSLAGPGTTWAAEASPGEDVSPEESTEGEADDDTGTETAEERKPPKDLQLTSGDGWTEVRVELPGRPELEDLTRLFAEGLALDRIRVFLPGQSIDWNQRLAVQDPLVREVRLVERGDEGGVLLTIQLGHPVVYELEPGTEGLRVRIEPRTVDAKTLEALADLQVRSGETRSEILVTLPEEVPFRDRTKLYPGRVAIDRVRLLLPGLRIDRSRRVTVDDPMVQEARLFQQEDGVMLAIAVRRAVQYSVRRSEAQLRVEVRPGAVRAGEAGEAGEEAAEVPLTEGEAGLGVDAETITYDQETNEIVARGDVTISRAASLLTAEEVRINRKTKDAVATGDVRFVDAQGRVQADRFFLNLDDETGVLENGRVYLPVNRLTIEGARLEKSYGQTYHIEDGVLTTCRCASGAQPWSIAGDEIDITLDGYGFIRDGTFRVFDVPILYVPWGAFPAKLSRQSGLLMPQVGFSGSRGFTYLQPLYFALNKSADLTVAADVETKARLGGLAEYRYALPRDSSGTLNAAFFDETFRKNAEGDIINRAVADPTIPDQRWSVTADVRQDLPLGMRAFADVLAVSDDFYLREIPTFSFDPQFETLRRTSRFATSRAGFYKFWDAATLIGEARFHQDFIQDDDLTLQRLPQLNLFASERFLDRNLKLSLTGEAVNFVRKEGFDGGRVDLAPEVGVPFRWQEYIRGWAFVGFRETAYALNDTKFLLPEASERFQEQDGSTDGGDGTNGDTTDGGSGTDGDTTSDGETDGGDTTTDGETSNGDTTDGTAEEPVRSVDKTPTRELFNASVRAGTEFYRVFDVGGEDVLRLKHTVEPEVEYLFIPDVNQQDLPQFDFVDRIERRNLVSYGFTTRLLAKVRGEESERPFYGGFGQMNAFSGVARSPVGDSARFRPGGEASPFDQQRYSGDEREEGLEGTEETRRDGGLYLYEEGDETDRAPEEGEAEAEDKTPDLDDEDTSIVEWGRLSIRQSYDFDRSLRRERNDQFSDVDVGLRLTPVRFFSLAADSAIDAREQSITATNVGFQIHDPRPRLPGGIFQSGQPASIGLSYRFITDDVLEELNGSVLFPIADSLTAFYQTRYNVLASLFLENRAGVRVSSQCRCWILDLSVSDRENPNETEMRAQVTLVGLGSIGGE